MSNYPPGVTGNEWQIAGPDFERDETKECGAEGFNVRTITKYGEGLIAQSIEALGRYDGNPHGIPAVQMWLRLALTDIEEVELESVCPFVGDVTVVGWQGVVSWECPLCRTQHEEEPE